MLLDECAAGGSRQRSARQRRSSIATACFRLRWQGTRPRRRRSCWPAAVQLPLGRLAAPIARRRARPSPAARHACRARPPATASSSAWVPAGVEHHDLVGADHGRQAVGDDDGGAVAGDAVEGRLDRFLGPAVERAGRLVEDQDRRVLEQRAGDGDALLLAARQLEPALADHRFIALRQRGDEMVDRRALRRALDLGLARPSRP
jgi:hypothetical protein